MIVRIGAALFVALAAHAGAYAIILIGSPKPATVQIKGGSVRISLMPTHHPVSEESERSVEDMTASEADAPMEPKPDQFPEPVTEPALPPLPEPAPVPEPEHPLLELEHEPQPTPQPDLVSTSEPVKTGPKESLAANSSAMDSSAAVAEASPPANALLETGSTTARRSSAQEAPSSAEIASTELGNAAEDNYNGALMRHMRKARKFDTNARRSSKISITIDPHGHVVEVRILRPSGDKTWDRRVIKELKRIAPYPAPPHGGTHSWSFDAVPR